MKIDGPSYIVDLARSQAVQKERAPGQAAAVPDAARLRTPDRVEISPRSREMLQLKRELEAMPEVRLDRVALARQNLQQGGYPVEPSVLAQKMLEACGKR